MYRGEGFWVQPLMALFCLGVVFVLAFPCTVVRAADTTSRENLTYLQHGLKGMKFVGPLAAKGESNPPIDTLAFKNGKLTSEKCFKYGFEPAPYWVRRDDDGLHFHAVLRSPEHGRVRYEGVFDGNELRAVAHWTKHRWYWTVDQDFYFTGRPVEPSQGK